MKREQYNKFDKNDNYHKNINNEVKKSDVEYSYFSRVLKEPFDSIKELREAEEAYYAKLRDKETKAVQKKSDAKRVEEAFVALNAARRNYKEDMLAVTKQYSDDLALLKAAFESSRDEVKARLAAAEDAYAAAIKEFTEKYPEGYHLTLKDGDFETTISGSASGSRPTAVSASDIINWLFNM